MFRHTGSFSFDVSQRCIILEDDLRPDLFADIEHLCLRNTEINWGLDVPMPKLRNLSLANVESRVWTPSDLFHQALKQPIIANIKMDYCHLEHYDFSSQDECFNRNWGERVVFLPWLACVCREGCHMCV